MLEAVVLINVKPGQMRRVEDALLAREGIEKLYSVAGAFDLVAILRTSRNERLEELVTGEIAALEGVERTTTLVAFRCLTRREADGTFSLGMPAGDGGP
ncbi:MAG: Lrp/AsnC ligand binding domain-containing protein [Acidobacteriota bacterium]|jgi:DNA-binding Lrp family transcriptional regulator